MAEAKVAQDLTQKVVPYLDRHFVIQLLDFLQSTGLYAAKDLLKAQVDVLAETNMVDFAIEKAKELSGTSDEPSYLVDRREEVVDDMHELQAKVQDLLELIDDDEKYEDMRKLKQVQEIVSTFNLAADAMDSLFSFAKLQYECGNYEMGAELLKHFRALTAQDTSKENLQKQLNALWGMLACYVADGQLALAAEMVLKIDEAYDGATKISRAELVLNRTWLLHWSLCCIFKCEGPAQQKLVAFFLQDSSLQILSIAAPHLLRYVAALLILHKPLQEHRSEELLGKMRQDRFWYSDPVTMFLEAVYVELDFDAAKEQLKACEAVLAVDWFLSPVAAEFKENCRVLIFETYCRIHQQIKLSMLAESLDLSISDAEVWIVKLIQHAKLDAKIDAESERVIMTRQAPNVYQQVVDKTKSLATRSAVLNASIDKRGRLLEVY